jgi:hypothetical protein
MHRLSFTLRDVFWLTLVVGMGVGWWVRERQTAATIQLSQRRARALERALEDDDWSIRWENDRLYISKQYRSIMVPFPLPPPTE